MEKKQLTTEQIEEITYRAGEMLEAMDTASQEMVKNMHTMRLAYLNFRAASREIKTRPEREGTTPLSSIAVTAALCAAEFDRAINAMKAREERVEQSSDCAGCWCNSCANIEKCVNTPHTHDIPDRHRPNPCWGCAPGMQYMPILEGEEHCTCAGYAEDTPDNG